MRWASPPASVWALRDNVRYSKPTLSRNDKRKPISFRTGFAIIDSVGDSMGWFTIERLPIHSLPVRIDLSVTLSIDNPSMVIVKLSFFNRFPLHVGHISSRIYFSISILDQSDSDCIYLRLSS